MKLVGILRRVLKLVLFYEACLQNILIVTILEHSLIKRASVLEESIVKIIKKFDTGQR